jgi:hypothetical protein
MNSRSLYLLCLRAYPAAFRERHGAEMLRIFEGEWRSARRAGWRATLAYAVHVFSDLVRTVPREHLAVMTHTGWLAFGTATFCGVLAPWALFSTGLFFETTILLFSSTVFFSYFAGVHSWRWPVTVAAWMPLAYFFTVLPHTETSGNWVAQLGLLLPLLTLFAWALAIALAGTGTGLLLRRIVPLLSPGQGTARSADNERR